MSGIGPTPSPWLPSQKECEYLRVLPHPDWPVFFSLISCVALAIIGVVALADAGSTTALSTSTIAFSTVLLMTATYFNSILWIQAQQSLETEIYNKIFILLRVSIRVGLITLGALGSTGVLSVQEMGGGILGAITGIGLLSYLLIKTSDDFFKYSANEEARRTLWKRIHPEEGREKGFERFQKKYFLNLWGYAQITPELRKRWEEAYTKFYIRPRSKPNEQELVAFIWSCEYRFAHELSLQEKKIYWRSKGTGYLSLSLWERTGRFEFTQRMQHSWLTFIESEYCCNSGVESQSSSA